MEELKGSIAFDATLLRAAQRGFHEKFFQIKREDLMKKCLVGKGGSSILFVVDASGSMGVEELMKSTKSLVFGLLNNAYQQRERVGMIVFRGTKAEMVLPFTNSVTNAQTHLQEIKTGGKTPLTMAIIKAIREIIIEKKRCPKNEQIILFFTDGRANVSISNEDPFEEALSIARKLASLECKIFVIDTDPTWISYPYAKDLAKEINAKYYKLNDILAGNIRELIYN